MRKTIFYVVVSLVIAVTANAIEISYDGFAVNDPNGGVAGYDPAIVMPGQTVVGSGYVADAVWQGGSGSYLITPGYTYPGLPTEGGHIVTEYSDLYANLDLSDAGPFAGLVSSGIIGGDNLEGTIYLSFLIAGEYNNNWGGLTLFRDGGEVLLMGRTWQNQYFSATAGDEVIGDPGVPFDQMVPHLIIAKFNFKADALDEVTVWIDPDLDTNEAGQSPAMSTTFTKSDLSFNQVVMRGDGVWNWDELRLGRAWRDVVGDRKSAIIANPQNGAKDVDVNTVLAWAPGEEALSVAEYRVYMSDTTDQLTSAHLVATTTSTAYTPAAPLAKDATYNWRVDSIFVLGSSDPNDWALGDSVSFDTELSYPVINSIAELTFAWVGETVTLSVDATDPLGVGLNYAWYIGASGDTSTPVGTDSPDLDVEVVDETVFANQYWCEVTNASGATQSDAASITEKVLLAHWPMESTPDPNANSTVPETPDSSFYINPNISYANIWQVEGVVGDALQFYEGALVTPTTSGYFDVMDDYCTISCWIRVPYRQLGDWIPFVSRNGESYGWQLREVWNSDSVGFTTRGTENDNGNRSWVAMDDGQWHFVVATFDSSAGVKKVYVDGLERVSDSTGTASIAQAPVPVVVAGRAWDSGTIDGFANDVAFDEVKLYNFPMTANEVADEYTAVVGTLCLVDYPGDITGDCQINLDDLSALASTWLLCSSYPDCMDFE